MRNKVMIGIIGIAVILIVVISTTYAYFTPDISKANEENKNTKIITTKLVTATLEYGDTVESDLTVYPGRKFVKTIRVTSEGGENLLYGNITITPNIEDFGNHIKYSVYEVENPNNIDINTICGASNPIGSNGKYYDAMSCDTTSLGSVIQSGTLVHEEVTKVPIVIEGKTDRTYYVIIEYENDKENPQDSEQGKHFRIELGFEETIITMSEYLIALSEKENSLVKINHEETIQTGNHATIDYRYVGSDPNNYVYFGCDDECTEDNLYRIIGIIPTQSEIGGEYEYRVKLIKANYYTETESGYLESGRFAPGGKGYHYSQISTNNNWQDSFLNTNILNKIYWESIKEFQEYISSAVWYLGALNYSYSTTYTANQFYTLERGNEKSYSGGELTTIANIGLMYPSDYGYSAGFDYANQSIDTNRQVYQNNAWLYHLEGKYYEWTITPETSHDGLHGYCSWGLDPGADTDAHLVYHADTYFGIRPTFYLKVNVKINTGNGTKEHPYRLFL